MHMLTNSPNDHFLSEFGLVIVLTFPKCILKAVCSHDALWWESLIDWFSDKHWHCIVGLMLTFHISVCMHICLSNITSVCYCRNSFSEQAPWHHAWSVSCHEDTWLCTSHCNSVILLHICTPSLSVTPNCAGKRWSQLLFQRDSSSNVLGRAHLWQYLFTFLSVCMWICVNIAWKILKVFRENLRDRTNWLTSENNRKV